MNLLFSASFLIVSLTPFIIEPNFLISSISSFEMINVVLETWTFFWTASVADAAAVNPNGIKTLLANELNTFSLMVTLFCNGPENMPRDFSDYTIF